jgi:hypothetical protein
VAFVPAAHTSPLASQYMARSTTMGLAEVTMVPNLEPPSFEANLWLFVFQNNHG